MGFATFYSRNSDELEEDCFEGNAKELLDYQTPLQPNSHLYSYSSNLNLPEFENCYGLDPKTQKYVSNSVCRGEGRDNNALVFVAERFY